MDLNSAQYDGIRMDAGGNELRLEEDLHLAGEPVHAEEGTSEREMVVVIGERHEREAALLLGFPLTTNDHGALPCS